MTITKNALIVAAFSDLVAVSRQDGCSDNESNRVMGMVGDGFSE
jgi:hypothetical protein